MRLVMDKSRYDTRKGARLVLACKLEASQKRPSPSVKDVVDRANEMKSVPASSVGGSRRRWNSRAKRRWTSEQRSGGPARSAENPAESIGVSSAVRGSDAAFAA
jgi:hypothetical protein